MSDVYGTEELMEKDFLRKKLKSFNHNTNINNNDLSDPSKGSHNSKPY